MVQSQSFLMVGSSHSWYESRQLSIIQVECQQSLLQQVESSVISPQGWLHFIIFYSSWIQAVIPPSVNPGSHWSSILIQAVINPSDEILDIYFSLAGISAVFYCSSWNSGSHCFFNWNQAVIIPSTEIRQSLFLQLKSGSHYSFNWNQAVIIPSTKIRQSLFLQLKSGSHYSFNWNQAVIIPSTEIRQSLFLKLKSGSHYSFNWNQGGHFPLALIFHLLQAVIIPPNPDSHYSSSNNSGSHYSSKSRKSLFL